MPKYGKSSQTKRQAKLVLRLHDRRWTTAFQINPDFREEGGTGDMPNMGEGCVAWRQADPG
jgi:hypothetical protein